MLVLKSPTSDPRYYHIIKTERTKEQREKEKLNISIFLSPLDYFTMFHHLTCQSNTQLSLDDDDDDVDDDVVDDDHCLPYFGHQPQDDDELF